jgi:hypothetical protein
MVKTLTGNGEYAKMEAWEELQNPHASVGILKSRGKTVKNAVSSALSVISKVKIEKSTSPESESTTAPTSQSARKTLIRFHCALAGCTVIRQASLARTAASSISATSTEVNAARGTLKLPEKIAASVRLNTWLSGVLSTVSLKTRRLSIDIMNFASVVRRLSALQTSLAGALKTVTERVSKPLKQRIVAALPRTALSVLTPTKSGNLSSLSSRVDALTADPKTGDLLGTTSYLCPSVALI